MAINLHIGMIFLKEKELYEKTMVKFMQKIYLIKEIDGFLG